MPVLSIIACEMLEDELVYVFSKDLNSNQLIIIENRQSFRFVRKLKARNCRFGLFPLEKVPSVLEGMHNSLSLKILNFLSKKEKNRERITVVVNILRFGLHADCEILKSEVYKNLEEMAAFSDGVLIFYGKCGDSLKNLELDFKDNNCSLYFLKDKNGDIADDCISVALGGNDTYAKVLNGENGASIFLTPMWASNWKEIKRESTSTSESASTFKSASTSDFDEHFLKSSFYNKVIKISNEISKGEEFDKNVLNFARNFNMNILEMEGSMEIARKSYLDARNDLCTKPHNFTSSKPP